MENQKSFLKNVCNLAVPVALQSMLQASFSVIDQIMIGQLGSVSVAGVGLAGKFSSVYTVMVSAVGTVAGIMISQYLGQKNEREVRRSFWINLAIAFGLAGIFTVLCIAFPVQLMGFYTKDLNTKIAAADYLRILAWTFLPAAGTALLSTLLRCMEKAMLPLASSIAAAILNTGLNYVLIFGKFGVSPLGAKGAAIATAVAQLANLFIMFLMYLKYKGKQNESGTEETRDRFNWRQYLAILLPILVCEFLWSLGENIYAGIYGHLGTESCAAMTLINPIQSLMIGALCGISQAAGILVGKMLGNKEYEEAYQASKKLIWYAFSGSCILSVLILLTRGAYVQLYQVKDSVRSLTRQILIAYALIAPFKVLNMTLGGGIIRSGGKTNYIMVIDMIGTWIFGVPLGFLSAFVLKLTIPYVYFILSLEECVRFGISMVVFRKRKWMKSLE